MKHIHFVGIKGVGMTSLALCAQNLGIGVTGSDVEEVFVTDAVLKKRGIKWQVGFSAKHLKPKPNLVITTGAHGGFSNPEVVAAKRMGIPVMSHAEALAWFAKGKKLIAVCGVGGKSTTASMIATILDYAGYHPSFAIGVGTIPSLGTAGRYDKKGKLFVTEADEFAVSPGVDNRPRFSLLDPKVTVVTNIEHDHPDIYPTFGHTKKVFREFFLKIPQNGVLIACIDNPNTLDVTRTLKVPAVTYGQNKGAQYRVNNIRFEEQKTLFSIKMQGSNETEITLRVPGVFNALNATAAFAVGRFLGIAAQKVAGGLRKYTGCRRRFEKIGEKKGILIYDDYAHHPTEILATLKACRQWFPKKRVIAVFQPHTYSRTKALFSEFAKSFKDADVVALMDIYASARETDTLGVNSQKLTRETAKYHKNVHYTGGHENTIKFLAKTAKPQSVILTMGAGNIFYIHNELVKQLA